MEKKTEKRAIKVAVTGPESTGKSWLAEHLAGHYRTLWVPEYSREYLQAIDRPYDYKDILKIAGGQLKAENAVLEKLGDNPLLFCDTEFIVTKIWCEVKFGRCHNYIDTLVRNHHYDLYLLCDIDLPWEFDPLREDPDRRPFLFDLYKNVLESNGFPYRIVRGSGNDRLVNAIKMVDELLA